MSALAIGISLLAVAGAVFSIYENRTTLRRSHATLELTTSALESATADLKLTVDTLARIAASPVNIITDEGDQAGRRMQAMAREALDRIGT